jgi:hypothetical protein
MDVQLSLDPANPSILQTTVRLVVVSRWLLKNCIEADHKAYLALAS